VKPNQASALLLLDQRVNTPPTAVLTGPASTPDTTSSIALSSSTSADSDGTIVRRRYELVSGDTRGYFDGEVATVNFVPWSPLNITGIVHWYDFDDTATVTIATGISAVTNKVSGGASLLQATAANQPARVLTRLAGDTQRNVAVLDGVDDVLVVTESFVTPVTLVIVARKRTPSPSAGTKVLCKIEERAVYASTVGLSMWSGTAQIDITMNEDEWRGPFHVFILRLSGSALTTYVDGTPETGGAQTTTATTNFIIGADDINGASAGDWEVGEVVICTSVLAAADLNNVGRYLASRWACPPWTTVV